MTKRIAGLLVALCALSACADRVEVTYNCDPQGATIYEEGVGLVGTCPVVAEYSPYDVKVSGGKVYTDRMRVVWVSGASMMVPATAISLSSDNRAVVNFVHPPNTIDSARDERFAAAYDVSLTPPGEKYIVSVGQSKNIFDAYNTGFTCTFYDLIGSVTSQCK
jgi:hypothetical protein